MKIAELSLSRIRTGLLPASLPQRLLPTEGKQGTEAQMFSGAQIVLLVMHDAIGGGDGPFRVGALQ